jgi:hypothetical protein
MNETFVVLCWNVTLLFVVMNRLHDLRTGITGYGSNFKYSLAIDGVKVFSDSSYNNRPQPGCEAATQTFCPLVEQCTTKKLTIDIETANVNCPSKNCEHNVDTCKRNYSTGESMASTESKFV